jgi:TPR repeat protein
LIPEAVNMPRRCATLWRASLAAVLMQVLIVAAASAGPYEDAQQAYDKRDYASALRLYRRLAQRGNPKAQEALGGMYSRGEGVAQDKVEALVWFNMADAERTGLRAYNKGDYPTALRIFRPLAKRGQVLAEYVIGLMYANGQGLPQDYHKTMQWHRKAAEQGEAKAQFSVGILYFKGLGTKVDHAEALKWYRRAANQGDPAAQYNLGAMYAKGDVVKRDPVTADMWYTLAATAQVRAAAAAQRQLAKSMSAAQRAEALKRARAFTPTPEP